MGFLQFFKAEQPPLVEQAFGDVKTMLEHGQVMFAAGTAHLLDNEILDVDLAALDEAINEREQDLRRVLLEHLTVDPNHELILSLKLISIVQEAERIGDLAKSLSRTALLAHKPRLGSQVEPLRKLRNQLLTMFDWTHDSFVQGDETGAQRVMKQHEMTKKALTDYLECLSNNESVTANESLVYALGARMMSRVSSHLANIASTVALPFDRIRSSPTWSTEDTVKPS
ncbi:MAG TPA: hypothetical protein VKP65_19060 [Rhodothermales bacterium]|nr:hypothetical protein [Rhodothermales bacterium]